jgi:hypothetical protein
MERIEWITSYQEGLDRARDEKKLLFMDFFNPN